MSDEREYDWEDVRADVLVVRKVITLLLPIWKRQVGTVPAGSDQDAALKAIEEAERELADQS